MITATLGWLLGAVVPLGALIFFSFQSSRRANPTVSAVVDSDQLRWSVATDPENQPQTWSATSIFVPPKVFEATSAKELWVRLPPTMEIEQVAACFDDCQPRPIPHLDTETSTVRIQLRNFADARELAELGDHRLRLRIRSKRVVLSADVLTVNIQRPCRWCGEVYSDGERLVEHVVCTHDNDVFRKVTLRTSDQNRADTPDVIYICKRVSDCAWYCWDDRRVPQGPVGLIADHTKAKHGHSGLSDGIAYQAVRDPEQVRSIIERDQKWIWKCQIDQTGGVTPCDGIIPASDDLNSIELKKRHLHQDHRNMLCKHH